MPSITAFELLLLHKILEKTSVMSREMSQVLWTFYCHPAECSSLILNPLSLPWFLLNREEWDLVTFLYDSLYSISFLFFFLKLKLTSVNPIGL